MKAFVFENGLQRSIRVAKHDAFYMFASSMALQKKCYLAELFSRRYGIRSARDPEFPVPEISWVVLLS